MQMQSVNSSNLSSVGFDENTETLQVEFHSGGLYQFSNVSLSVYTELMNAASHGRYFHSFIKGNYPERKIR